MKIQHGLLLAMLGCGTPNERKAPYETRATTFGVSVEALTGENVMVHLHLQNEGGYKVSDSPYTSATLDNGVEVGPGEVYYNRLFYVCMNLPRDTEENRLLRESIEERIFPLVGYTGIAEIVDPMQGTSAWGSCNSYDHFARTPFKDEVGEGMVNLLEDTFQTKVAGPMYHE